MPAGEDIAHGIYMWADYPIFGDFSKIQAISFDAEDLLNLSLITSTSGKKKYAYISTPGLKLERMVQTGTAESRALFTVPNGMYYVYGSNVSRIDPLIVSTPIGQLTTNQNSVSICTNTPQNQIVFADGANGYVYATDTGDFTVIQNLASPIVIINLGGFFFAPLKNTNNIQYSSPNDATQWQITDNFEIENYQGNNVSAAVLGQRLFFFKNTSTEVWYLNGFNPNLPVSRDNNFIFNYGCLTNNSVQVETDYLFWLSQTKDGVSSFMMAQTGNYYPQKISDDSIDRMISGFTNPSDMSSYTYKNEYGHLIYVANWTTDNKTFCYDVNMQSWHRMAMTPQGLIIDGMYTDKQRHIANCHAYLNGTHYIAAYNSPIIYSFSNQYPDNAGEPIARVRTCKNFFDQAYRMIQVNSLQIDMQLGIGNNDGEYTDPKCYLLTSRNGGGSFGNAKPASIGKIGKTLGRLLWRRGGCSRDFVHKFVIVASVAPISILGAAINYEVLTK